MAFELNEEELIKITNNVIQMCRAPTFEQWFVRFVTSEKTPSKDLNAYDKVDLYWLLLLGSYWIAERVDLLEFFVDTFELTSDFRLTCPRCSQLQVSDVDAPAEELPQDYVKCRTYHIRNYFFSVGDCERCGHTIIVAHNQASFHGIKAKCLFARRMYDGFTRKRLNQAADLFVSLEKFLEALATLLPRTVSSVELVKSIAPFMAALDRWVKEEERAIDEQAKS